MPSDDVNTQLYGYRRRCWGRHKWRERERPSPMGYPLVRRFVVQCERCERVKATRTVPLGAEGNRL